MEFFAILSMTIQNRILTRAMPSPPPDSIVRSLNEKILDLALAAIPDGLTKRYQYFEFLDRWYVGEKTDQLEGSLWWTADHGQDPMTKESLVGEGSHAIFHQGVTTDIRYNLAAHSLGYGLCSERPVSTLCNNQVFAKWPYELFRTFGEEYAASSLTMRPPGYYFDLPPMVSLVLSRASRREEIPEALRDLRDEFETDREMLWDLVDHLWNSRTRREQEKAAAFLKGAAENLFRVSFSSRRINVLAVGLSLAEGKVAKAGEKVLESDRANQAVSAVSFAKHLSTVLRNDLKNERELLWRFLTPAERKDFGV